MGWSKKFGKAIGKMAETIPLVSDIAVTIGEMGENVPVRPVADYHRGLKEGASAADLKAAKNVARRERKTAREAQERTVRAEERAEAVREAAERRREREAWERTAAALDAERLEAARKRTAGRETK